MGRGVPGEAGRTVMPYGWARLVRPLEVMAKRSPRRNSIWAGRLNVRGSSPATREAVAAFTEQFGSGESYILVFSIFFSFVMLLFPQVSPEPIVGAPRET